MKKAFAEHEAVHATLAICFDFDMNIWHYHCSPTPMLELVKFVCVRTPVRAPRSVVPSSPHQSQTPRHCHKVVRRPIDSIHQVFTRKHGRSKLYVKQREFS